MIDSSMYNIVVVPEHGPALIVPTFPISGCHFEYGVVVLWISSFIILFVVVKEEQCKTMDRSTVP